MMEARMQMRGAARLRIMATPDGRQGLQRQQQKASFEESTCSRRTLRHSCKHGGRHM